MVIHLKNFKNLKLIIKKNHNFLLFQINQFLIYLPIN